MPIRDLPHSWTSEQVRQILGRHDRRSTLAIRLAAMAQGTATGGSAETGRRDLNFAAASPAITVRDSKGGRSLVVPAHPELVEAFRSIPK